jgi:hypothetical protein
LSNQTHRLGPLPKRFFSCTISHSSIDALYQTILPWVPQTHCTWKKDWIQESKLIALLSPCFLFLRKLSTSLAIYTPRPHELQRQWRGHLSGRISPQLTVAQGISGLTSIGRFFL